VSGVIAPGGLVPDAALVLVPVVAGLGTYVALAVLLHVEELTFVRGIVSRRIVR
jgi:hypothetical protein